MVVCVSCYVPCKNVSLIYTHIINFRSSVRNDLFMVLKAVALRDLYHATPAIKRNLFFEDHIQKTCDFLLMPPSGCKASAVPTKLLRT